MTGDPVHAPRSAGEGVVTILVVDDQEVNRLLIRHLFDTPEYRVLEAADGVEALAVTEKEEPDCILLDLDMPRLGGFDVLDRLMANPRTRSIPVVILTATDVTLGGMERALTRGAVDYIVKPISPARVLVRVRGAVERRRLLRDLEQLRASFTSMLVHDLRTPLTVIRGRAELLSLSETLTEQELRHLAGIQDACERMMRLIGEILDLSKLEAGQLRLERHPVKVEEIAAALVEQFQPVAAAAGVTLGLVMGSPVSPIQADPARLEQVLMNLLANALKFTPRGGAIEVLVTDRPDGVDVAVTDTGPGIAPAEVPLLFQAFSQTSAGKHSVSPGSGLGLVVCRHLVEAHGGRIWAESEPGAGARFVFHLPR